MPESPEIFEQAMSNLPDTFSPQLLFLDAEKYRIIQQALAERLYRELHGDSK